MHLPLHVFFLSLKNSLFRRLEIHSVSFRFYYSKSLQYNENRKSLLCLMSIRNISGVCFTMIVYTTMTFPTKWVSVFKLGRTINQSDQIGVKGGKFKDQRLFSSLFLLPLSPRPRYSRLAASPLAARMLQSSRQLLAKLRRRKRLLAVYVI